LFPPYNLEKVLENTIKSDKMSNPNYKYYGKTKEQISEEWEKNRIEKSGAGTKTHFNIECYYNNIEVEDDSVEFQYFKNFLKDYPELEAYRTEWCVYYEEVKLSGSIDMVFRDKNTGEYLIYDWKRVKEIEYENSYGKTAIVDCIKEITDTNYWHYSIQLNIYRKILQDKYDMKITGLFLVVLHPNNPCKTYERLDVPFLDKEIEDLWEYRKEQLKKDGVV
jgi:ATP-dependent exoDNAse (exonuclease V) beta subunit